MNFLGTTPPTPQVPVVPTLGYNITGEWVLTEPTIRIQSVWNLI